jgi:glycosyltransferase involved in cell wall biosynthesis
VQLRILYGSLFVTSDLPIPYQRVKRKLPPVINPLVSVVLTCHNQEHFVAHALRSVADQTYPNIQLIVIENGSTDGTWHRLKDVLEGNKAVTLIRNELNVGLCRAFNQGLAIAKGKYIIDLSGDDIFFANRIERQVAVFEQLDSDYAVLFSNATQIDTRGNFVKYHYPVDELGRSIWPIPSGNVYSHVLQRYFISTPTMMIRTSVLTEMNGFDENLHFEDFDFWVRSSFLYKYHYQDEVLTKKRNTPGSLASNVYLPNSGILESCYVVCNKAYELNRSQDEFDLLAKRIRTFIRKCFYAQEFDLAFQFLSLLNDIEDPSWKTKLFIWLCKKRFRVNVAYRFYIRNIHKYLMHREVLRPGSVNSES